MTTTTTKVVVGADEASEANREPCAAARMKAAKRPEILVLDIYETLRVLNP